MIKEAFLLLSFALLCFTIQLPSSSSTLPDTSRVVLFHRKQTPLNWINNGFSSPKKEIRFFIALKQRNTKQLEETLYRVAHPSSPLYGQYLTYQQVLDIVAPPKAHHDLVVKWLVNGGVSESNIISRRDSLEVLAEVKIVESLFNTTMHSFVNSKTGRVIEAHMGNISIPASVHQYIDMVSALSLFPPQRRRTQPSELQKRQTTTPWTIAPHLRQVYNIPANLRATNPKTTQAAVEFEWPGCFSYNDMIQYSQLVELPFTNITRLIPPNQWSNQGCDAETAMDLQLMSNVGSGADTWFFTNQFWMYEFTQTLMSLDNPPLVTSLSWGWMEAQQCDQITNAQCSQLGVDSAGYVRRTDTEFLKAATMGLSVIVCTQDEGAPSDNNNYCSLDSTKTPVWPIYPSSSPWVTAVGATTIIAGTLRDGDDASQLDNLFGLPACQTFTCNNGSAEKVAMSIDQDTLFTSGGGFSNYTARPAYQDNAVDAYIKSKGLRPPPGTWGVNNRGYPDISTAGSQTLVVLGADPQWNGGTSASTPTFAGLVSLLNDYRLNKGKKQLGFLNFLLYDMGDKFPQAFHPITQGNNTCTGWELNTCCKYGYSAIAGWNPAVGFGTPNFANILSYISKLP